ncbi:MAG: hypothetical protein Q7W16_00690 [Coriobacteriia bacterium]|nr:hypothetical protein [Coriobacteriia bacterium]
MGEQEKLENIKQLQDSMHKELPNSPLQQIREKEMEIAGGVLAAKKKAEQVVSDARKKASETLAQAEAEGTKQARAVEESKIGEAESEAARILANVDNEVADMQARVAKHSAQAVKTVIEAVTKI